MAYGVKYRFQLESYNKTVYRVDLLEDGYSGTITTRPLGKAPVLRMQDAAPFRSTSCDLALECQSDGEYIDLYTTDPFHFKVEVYRIDDNDGAWIIWRGYVPTEIYSEPDIAPPYDVRITATDGIGLLKEYTFEAVGAKSIRAHICDLLEKTGDSAPMYYYATRLCKLGSTEVAFMDEALIDLDYLAGKNCYDVLKEILVSLRSVLMYRGSHWLIVREVDVQMSSAGMLTAVQCITSDPYYVPSSTTVKEGKTVGQMGAADMWPVGYLTRRVVPAKKAVHVRAPWHYVNGYPEVSANGWTVSDNASFDSTNKLYHIGTRSQSVATAKGAVQSSKTLSRFVDNFKVVIKANAHSVYGNDVSIAHYVRVYAAWRSTAGGSITTYYWDSEYGWTTSSSYSVNEIGIEGTNEAHDPNACSIVEVTFPPVPDDNPGYLTIKVDGSLVDIYGIEVLPATVAGYEDNILIDNGARGEAETIDVFGGRLMSSNFINLDFYQGIFFHSDGQTSGPDMQFSDLMNIGKDFMSLAALAYAREVAAPRIEISGKLNHEYDTVLGMPAPFIKSHGVWALMKSYDWDMMTEDVSFTAVTLPSVILDVEDEIINSVAPEGGISGGSSSGSGGGGGGGGSYTLPIASASTLGGVKVGTGLSIDANGVLAATGSGSGVQSVGVQSLSASTDAESRIAKITVDGVETVIYNDVAWGSVDTTAKTVGLKINGTTKTLLNGVPLATSSAIGGIKLGYTQSGKNYPLLLDTNSKAYVNVPWESTSIDGVSRKAPELVIYRGFNEGQTSPFAPYLMASHPAIGTVTGAEFVLMVMSPRRVRKTGNRVGKARKSWGAALGATGEGGLTFSGRVTLLNLRTYILQNYVSVYGQSTASMTYATYQGLTAATGFGHPTGDETYYRKKIKRSRVFGIAVRWQNPAFSEIASGPLSDHTTEIQENGVSYQRWIYSDVAPIRVFAEISNLDGVASHNGGVIGFQLLP